VESRIAGTLKAIAQIESGRRKDVRLSSLSALADALEVSVDYLIGTTATLTAQLLEHRAFTYGTDEEFVAGVAPFLGEGMETSACFLAVTTLPQIALLRDALGDRAEQVEYADSLDWYSSPTAALSRYGAFVKQKFDAGAAWIRIVGEPVWAGRSDPEITAWTRYESLLNLAFASSPATIVCPYDVRSLPPDVVEQARQTHPEVAHGDETTASTTYREPAEFLLA
jgi:hypothetical protein